jgi:small-conductance mechanosensitive channel
VVIKLLKYQNLILVFSLVFLLLFGAAAQAQTEIPPDWEQTATSAEKALSDDGVSNAVLENLRASLATQRQEALAIQDAAQPGISSLQSQLDALGPAPADGASESDERASRRARLEAEIETARAPTLDAEIAYNRAENLIERIDAELLKRLTDQLTRLGPTPLNPANWAATSEHIGQYVEKSRGAFALTMGNGALRDGYVGGLPFAALMLLVALASGYLALPRIERILSAYAVGRSDQARFWIYGFGRTAAMLILSLITAFFAVSAIEQIAAPMLTTALRNSAIPTAALSIVFAYFLSKKMFGDTANTYAVLDRGEVNNRRASGLIFWIGIVIALIIVTQMIAEDAPFTEASQAVLFLPLCVIGALLLWSLCRIIKKPLPHSSGDEEETASLVPQNLGLIWFAKLAGIVALITPVLVAVGYLNLGKFLFGPTLLSFIVIGFLMVIFCLLRAGIELWLGANGNEEKLQDRARYQLVPVVLGFVLVCIGLPILALVWGARVTDLQEIWTWLRDGVPIGETRFSVTDLMIFALVFAIGYALTRGAQSVLRNSVLPRTQLDLGAKNALVTGLGYVGIVLAAIFAITSTGLDLSNLAIVAGALSVGIGFGLQTIVSNFVSGIILLIERPIKQGDWIEVAGYSGNVKQISVRSTIIDTFDKASVIVPNSELIAGTVLNRTYGNLMGRILVPIGVAYGSDLKLVKEILTEIAQSNPSVLRYPAPLVTLAGFGADSIDFEIRAHLRDVNSMLTVTSDINFEIAEKFAEAGVDIPFAQREVNLKNVREVADLLAKAATKKG